MEDYKVDIRLPRDGDEDPTKVIISGDQDSCEDCIDHLKMLEEEYIQDAAEQDWERDYLKPTRQVDNKESNKKKDGFHVSKAPWDVSNAEQDWERDYLKPTRQVENKESNKKKDGFMVSKAPWDVSSAEAFPSLGGGGGGGASSAPTAWGPKTGRRWE